MKRNLIQKALIAAVIGAGGTALSLTQLPVSAQTAQSVTLVWDANTEPGIAGYRLYYGTASGNYPSRTEVGNATTTTVSNLTVGTTYYFVVTDYNNAGESLPSNEVAYTAVATPNSPPTVSLAAKPSTGQKFVQPVSIVLTASPSDSDGSIVRVEFYNQNSYLGEATSPPYTYILSHPTPGKYNLTARAFDDQGASTTSNPVTVTMTAPPPPRLTR